MRAAIYSRLSFDRYGSGLGVERQEQDAHQLASQLGWEVVATFQDNDTSAYSGRRRKGYEALLRALKDGQIEAVIAWHADRLHRSLSELEDFIDVVEQHGVQVHMVKGGLVDLATPTGRLVARQLGSIARYESEHRAERVARAYQQRVASGRFGGGPRVYGFQADGATIEPAEAAELVKAAEAVLAGVPVRAIARDLRERGVPTASGAPWVPQSLRSILLRPRNAGIVVHGGEELPVRTAAILPEDTWRAVVARLNAPERRNTPGPTPSWLGSGLYRCGVCGAGMRCSAAGGRPQRVYRCERGHVARNAAALDAFVEDVIVERLSRPDAADLLAAPGADGQDPAKLHTEALTLQQRLEGLSTAYADGDITLAQLRSGSERARKALETVQAQMATAAQVNPLAPLVGAQDPRAVWNGLDLGRRRAVLDLLMTVSVLPAGRRPGFDPNFIRVEPKGAA